MWCYTKYNSCIYATIHSNNQKETTTMNQQEQNNYNLLSLREVPKGGKFIKEYRAFEGDYRVIVEYPNGYQARYTISGDVSKQM